MMIMGGPKKIASLIIEKRNKGGDEDRAAQLRDESMEKLSQMEPEGSPAEIALADEANKMISAVEAKAPELIAKSFLKMFRIVEMMEPEEYEEDESEEMGVV